MSEKDVLAGVIAKEIINKTRKTYNSKLKTIDMVLRGKEHLILADSIASAIRRVDVERLCDLRFGEQYGRDGVAISWKKAVGD